MPLRFSATRPTTRPRVGHSPRPPFLQGRLCQEAKLIFLHKTVAAAPTPRAALLTIADAAAVIGFSRASVTRWTYFVESRPAGWPEAVRVGAKAIRYRLSDLERFVAGLPPASAQPRVLAPNVNAGRGRSAGPVGGEITAGVPARPKRGRPRKAAATIEEGRAPC